MAEMNTSNVKVLQIQKNLDLASGYLCTLTIKKIIESVMTKTLDYISCTVQV